eukprot:8314928-Alexandrium_andersonii.AAC.1
MQYPPDLNGVTAADRDEKVGEQDDDAAASEHEPADRPRAARRRPRVARARRGCRRLIGATRLGCRSGTAAKPKRWGDWP